MPRKLEGKVAVVTGASKGMGGKFRVISPPKAPRWP